MAKLVTPKRTNNVNELQVAVMQWELTLVEHESKFSEVVADSETAAMRSMLPKDLLERVLDGPFHYEELGNRVCICGREAGWSRSPTRGDPEPLGSFEPTPEESLRREERRVGLGQALPIGSPIVGSRDEPYRRYCDKHFLHLCRARHLRLERCHSLALRGLHRERPRRGPPRGGEHSPASPCFYGVGGHLKTTRDRYQVGLNWTSDICERA